MGINIDKTTYSKKDYKIFQHKLFEQLEQLKNILKGNNEFKSRITSTQKI